MIGRVQAQYYSQILKIVRDNPGISRIQLSNELNLDRSSISNLTSSLVRKGILRHMDGSHNGDRSGRRQIPLAINPNYGIVIGIEVQAYSLVSVFTDLFGRVVFIQKEIMEINGDNLHPVLVSAIDRCKDEAERRGLRLMGIGIGISGIVNAESGFIFQSRPLNIHEPIELIPLLQKECPFPLYLDNDTNCCCWGILAFSPERNIRDFLYVLVELEEDSAFSPQYKRMGTGLGFALDGKVFYGNSNSAGEFKSFLCRTLGNDQFNIDYNTRLRMKSDPVLRSQFLEELAQNIAYIINLLNLSHVFLGGGLDAMKDELSVQIQKELAINWVYDTPVDLIQIYNKPEDYPAAVGAAGMAVERLFDIPFMQVSQIVTDMFTF